MLHVYNACTLRGTSGTSRSVHKPWQLYSLTKNVATQEISIHIKRMCHIPVNAAIRWGLQEPQVGSKWNTPFESWFHCFIVEYKVNMQQTVQH
jgi:hypothetical protein